MRVDAAAVDGTAVDGAVLGGVPTERLEAAVTTLAARLAAATCEWLEMIAELDRRRAYQEWECVSMAHWLSWKCALSLPAAREHVRVGRALAGMPLVRAAFGAGQLSYSKVRALTRLVTLLEMEASLVEIARVATAAQLDRIAGGYVRAGQLADPATTAANVERRYLRYALDDDGMATLTVRAPSDVVATIMTAVNQALAGEIPAEPGVEVAARRVDALEALATRYLQPQPDAAAATLVVRVDPAPPDRRVEARIGGLPISTAAFERLRCDAKLAFERSRPDGGIDRTPTRPTMPRAVRRAVMRRDRHTCRWPSCTNTANLHVHHIVFRSRAGGHTIENLVVLCAYHHRAVHDRGWRIHGTPDGDLEFVGPRGRIAHATVEIDLRAQVEHLADLYADDIDPHTITTATGERLDLHWAVGSICDTEHYHRTKRAHSRGSLTPTHREQHQHRIRPGPIGP